MKVYKVPEKIYIFENPILDFTKLGDRQSDGDIEYIRIDAFIEKAWDWVDDNILSSNQQDKSRLYFEQFKKYMEGE
jgi:hypothetical protein